MEPRPVARWDQGGHSLARLSVVLAGAPPLLRCSPLCPGWTLKPSGKVWLPRWATSLGPPFRLLPCLSSSLSSLNRYFLSDLFLPRVLVSCQLLCLHEDVQV